VIAVAVPVPFLDLLTYNVPPGIPTPPIGARVRVPIATRVVTGVVVEHLPPDGGTLEIKPIIEVVDADGYVPAQVVELCRWVADYYVSGIGDALAMAMPPGARAKASGYRTRRVAQLTAGGQNVWGLTPI
jgi:primosomal protein N' (replication factor Y)